MIVRGKERLCADALFGRRHIPARRGQWPCRRMSTCRVRSHQGSAGCATSRASGSPRPRVISTMKVDWPEARSSEAPMRVKMRSTTPMRAVRRRDEAADLRHQHNERDLPHIGGFTGHIRAGHEWRRGSRRSRAPCRSGRTALSLSTCSTTGWRPSCDVQLAGEVDLRAAVILPDGQRRKARQHVQLRPRRAPCAGCGRTGRPDAGAPVRTARIPAR